MNECSASITECIAVVAGSGMFPSLLISHLKQSKKKFVVLGLKGNAFSEIATGIDHIFIELGEIGRALAFFKQNQVREIVFVGKIQRPSLFSMKLDMQGVSFLSRMGINIFKGGDDRILSYIIKLLEEQGFKIVGPEKFLPSLIMPSGVLSKVKPTKRDYEDISTGQAVLTTLGDSDIGQAIVVENGYVLGIEASEGTDNLISRCGKLKKETKNTGVLIKMKKTAQDTRIDLPGIGSETFLKAYEAGLRGIAVESKNGLIIDIDSVIKKADELNLFLLGID